MSTRRYVKTGASALFLFPVVLGCQEESLAGPQCEELQGAPVGTWSHMDLPPGFRLPGGDAASTDGSSLFLFGSGCTECGNYVLDTSEGTWRAGAEASLPEYASSAFALATPGYFFLSLASRVEGDSGWVEYSYQRLLHDRTDSSWSILDLPTGVDVLGKVHWTGKQFLFWGRKDTEDPDLTAFEIGQNPDTPWLWFYDGHLLNPSTGEWTPIPPAREDARYLMSQGGPSLESVWTSSGLFVWGTNPEQTERWGALFDVESMSWEILEIGEDAPPLLRNHRMLGLGDDVYLFAGVTPGNDSVWRRLWRYSVPRRMWEEIDVPKWADPLLGTLVNGRLAFTGRCQGGDLYDPATNTWKALSAEGGPPSSGVPRGAGSFLTITDTYYGEQETNQVWTLDLRDELAR